MFQPDTLGRWLIIIGVSLAVLGLLFLLLGKVPFLSQLGRLPGDLHYKGPDGRFSCTVPLVSSLLLSLLLTVIINIIVRLLNR